MDKGGWDRGRVGSLGTGKRHMATFMVGLKPWSVLGEPILFFLPDLRALTIELVQMHLLLLPPNRAIVGQSGDLTN